MTNGIKMSGKEGGRGGGGGGNVNVRIKQLKFFFTKDNRDCLWWIPHIRETGLRRLRCSIITHYCHGKNDTTNRGKVAALSPFPLFPSSSFSFNNGEWNEQGGKGGKKGFHKTRKKKEKLRNNARVINLFISFILRVVFSLPLPPPSLFFFPSFYTTFAFARSIFFSYNLLTKCQVTIDV